MRNSGVSRCCGNFSLLWREFMWSAVTVFPNSPKISDVIRREFVSIWELWTREFTKGVLKRKFSGIVTTFFSINNFQNIWAMKLVFFFSKSAKFYLDFKYARKSSENDFGFGDNGAWSYSCNLVLLSDEFKCSTLNVLENSPEISHVIRRDV